MRILLAEDERALSNVLVAILKHNNYSVDAVYDGEEALEYLKTDLYDALILDVMMPKKDGFTVLKELRASGSTMPVLILTARSELEDKISGLDSGADDYLTKPFETKELLARLRAVLRRKGEMSMNTLTLGNLTLDRASYEMRVGEKSEKLSHKEFQMLEMLMLRPDGVIPSQMFMDKIWGYDSDAEISAVWVYLSYLRKKLAQLGANVRIRVSRNIGYALEVIK